MDAERSQVPISKRLIAINSVSAIVARLLTAAVFLWVIRYLVQRIPETELAILPIVMSVSMLLPMIQTVLSAGLARHVTEALARNDLTGVTKIVSSQLPLLLLGGVLVTVFGTLLAYNIEHFIHVPRQLIGDMRFMLLLVVGRLALAMALTPFNTGLFARQQFVRTNTLEVTSALLRAGIMLWLVLGVSPSVKWVTLSQVASQTFFLLTSTALSMRALPALRFQASLFDWVTCRRVMTFGFWTLVADLAFFIRRAADPPILNQLASPHAVNEFFFGSSIETLIRELSDRTTRPLIPALTAMHALRQKARLASAFLRGGRIALWASLFLAVPLITFSHEIFAMYLGDKYTEYQDAATVMVLLLLAYPFIFPGRLFPSIAQAREDIRPVALRSLAVQLANLGLTLLLVGPFHMGAIGSAVATLTAFAVFQPLAFWPLALRTLDIRWNRFVAQTLVPGILPAMISGGTGFLCAQLLGDTPFVRLAFGIPVCLITHIIAVGFALKPGDRTDLGRLGRLVGISMPK